MECTEAESLEVVMPHEPHTAPIAAGSNDASQAVTRARRWPFDAAVTIALFALLLSVVQLALTTPLLLNLYTEPKIVVENVSVSGGLLVAGFRVFNKGRSTADGVEVGVVISEFDEIKLLPDLGASVVGNGSSLARTYRVAVPYLAEGDSFTILVHKPSNLSAKDSTLARSGMPKITPGIAYARSRSGPAQVVATRFTFPGLEPRKLIE